MFEGAHLIFWLPYLVFVIHTVEEIPGFAAWATRHFGTMTTWKFTMSHIPLILLVFFVSLKAAEDGYNGGWVLMATAFQWQFGLNAIFHLTTTITFKEYSPGTVTAATVSIPATIYFLTTVWQEGRLTGSELTQALVWGTLIAVAAIGILFLHPKKEAIRRDHEVD